MPPVEESQHPRLLENRVVIVTGAGRGIGRATAFLLAAEGAKVVVNDTGVAFGDAAAEPDIAQDVCEAISAAGGNALASRLDVSKSKNASELVALAVEQFARVDILINNAGILKDRSLLKLSDDDWQEVLDANLSAPFFMLRAAATQMKSQRSGGSIVNTTSRAGLLGNFGQANYSAATAGVYGLTRTASVELQRHDIRVNAVAPLAKTRLTKELTIFQNVDSMGPEHVAPLHLFLASDLASEVSGVVIGVAGGKLSAYRLNEGNGAFKEGSDASATGSAWTAREIAEHWTSIAKL